MDIVKTGSIWVLRTAPMLDVNGARLAGLTDIKCSVSRLTSGTWQWLDTADSTFRAVPAGYQYTMTAVDATKAAGVYAYALDFASVTNAALGDQIFIDIQQTSLTNAINANQAGGGVYGYVVDKVEANLTVSTATLATPTNITAGTITTVTNLTNAPTNGDLTATMKASVTAAATAATPTAAAVTGAVGSIGAGGIAASSFAASAITSTVIATDAIGAAQVAASAVAEIQSGLALEATLTAIEGAGWTASDNLHTIAGYGAPPSAAMVSAAVNADITTAHGAGSYLTASTAGLATAGDVTASTTAVNAHTDGAVAPLATAAALAAVQADADDIQTRLPAALVAGRIDASVGAMATDTITATALAASAVAEIQSGLAVPGSAMTLQADAITAATIAPGAIGASEAPLLANLDVTVSSRLASASYTAPPSAAAVSAQVAADLATAHGAGSWATADISTLATAASLAAVAVDATKSRRALWNRRALSSLGVFTLYADDAVTPLVTATVTDVSGGVITVQPGDAARTTALV